MNIGRTTFRLSADHENQLVVVKFDEPVDFIALDPDKTKRTIMALASKYRELTGKYPFDPEEAIADEH